MKKATAGLAIIALMSLMALLAPWISPADPQAMSLVNRLQAPSLGHWLGLDEDGSDVLSKIIYGARVSLGVGFSVVAFSVVTGLLVGSTAGYRGGWTDHVIMRIVDIFRVF